MSKRTIAANLPADSTLSKTETRRRRAGSGGSAPARAAGLPSRMIARRSGPISRSATAPTPRAASTGPKSVMIERLSTSTPLVRSAMSRRRARSYGRSASSVPMSRALVPRGAEGGHQLGDVAQAEVQPLRGERLGREGVRGLAHQQAAMGDEAVDLEPAHREFSTRVTERDAADDGARLVLQLDGQRRIVEREPPLGLARAPSARPARSGAGARQPCRAAGPGCRGRRGCGTRSRGRHAACGARAGRSAPPACRSRRGRRCPPRAGQGTSCRRRRRAGGR